MVSPRTSDAIIRVTPVSSSEDRPTPQLRSLRIRVTDQCNMRCRHCARPAPRQGALFDFARFGPQLLEDLQTLRTGEVVITGGEPTLEMDLTCAIATRLMDAGIASILFTNLYAVTRGELQRLLEAGVFTMHVSIDGMAATHDRIRGRPGAFVRTLANMRTAAEMGFQVVARMTLMQQNVDEVEQVADAVRDAGAPFFKIRPVVPSGRAGRELCVSPERLADAVRRVIDLSSDHQVMFGSSCFEFLQGTERKLQAGCFNKHLHVDPHGNVVPCGYVKLPLGNLSRVRLPEIFYGPRLNALRALPLPAVCSACEYRLECHAGCRACALGWGLRLGEPDTYCSIAASRPRLEYAPGTYGKYRITQHGGDCIEIESLTADGHVLFDPPAVGPDFAGTPAGRVLRLHTSEPVDRIDSDFCSVEGVGLTETAGLIVVEFDGLRFCHLGRFDRALTEDEIASVRPIDALIGSGGGSTERISANLRLFGARIFLPIHGLEATNRCTRGLPSSGVRVRRFAGSQILLDLNTLPQEPEVWLVGTTADPV